MRRKMSMKRPRRYLLYKKNGMEKCNVRTGIEYKRDPLFSRVSVRNVGSSMTCADHELKHPFDDARNVSAEMTADKGTENRSSCGRIRERKFHIVNQPVVHLIDRPSTGAKRFLNIPEGQQEGVGRSRTRLVIKKGWPAGAKKLLSPPPPFTAFSTPRRPFAYSGLG